MSIKNTKGNATSIYYIKHVTCVKVLQELEISNNFNFIRLTKKKIGAPKITFSFIKEGAT